MTIFPIDHWPKQAMERTLLVTTNQDGSDPDDPARQQAVADRLMAAAKKESLRAAVKRKSQGFRDRAKDCRNLAKGARHVVDRIMLEEIAEDLDAEATSMEAERLNGR